jgi:hypothetical protein
MDFGNVSESITAVAALLALVVAVVTIRAKRSDDRRADKLSRINRQISELYGKLSILDEAGGRNWYAFVSHHSNDLKILGREFMRFFPYDVRKDEPITQFNPPPPKAEQLEAYRKWLRTLFMKTNEGMLEVIYNNADLAIGQKMPQVFVSFAEHVASLRILLLKLDEEEKLDEDRVVKGVFLNDWREYVKLMAPHPGGSMGHYIGASYEILKEEQERLLSTHDTPLTEKEIAHKIVIRQWEKEDYWCKREYEVRTAAGEIYEYKPVPKPKSL